MAYSLYTKNELGEIVAVTPAIDERVSNLETKAVETDLHKLDVREQTLTTEQKTQVVQNLAGTFLPLTGGTMSGSIFLNANRHYIGPNTSAEYSGLELSGGNIWGKGAGLFLRSVDATGPGQSGQWGLVSHDASGAAGILVGLVDDILFNGKVIDRIDGFYTRQFEGGNCSALRYISGLQIITAGVTIPENQVGTTLTFAMPFIDIGYSMGANGASNSGNLAITWDSDTTTSIRLYRRDYNLAYSFPTHVKCVFIGRWK